MNIKNEKRLDDMELREINGGRALEVDLSELREITMPIPVPTPMPRPVTI